MHTITIYFIVMKRALGQGMADNSMLLSKEKGVGVKMHSIHIDPFRDANSPPFRDVDEVHIIDMAQEKRMQKVRNTTATCSMNFVRQHNFT